MSQTIESVYLVFLSASMLQELRHQSFCKQPHIIKPAVYILESLNDHHVCEMSLAVEALCTNEIPVNLRIAIVGGGIAGLATALAIVRRAEMMPRDAVHVKVDVFERDESLAMRRQGFGLTLTYNTVGFWICSLD